jgi:flagellar protein FlaG
MQISAVLGVPAPQPIDRPEPASSETTQDRTRQDHNRQMAQAVRTVNESGNLPTDRELTIALDRHSGEPVIRLVDRQTREVIQQIPGERVLRMAEEFKRATAQKAAPGGTDWQQTHG